MAELEQAQQDHQQRLDQTPQDIHQGLDQTQVKAGISNTLGIG
jgi:hypothetical protein